MYILGFCFFAGCWFVILVEGRLDKKEYFTVIRGKAVLNADQGCVFVVDFSRNTVRVIYPCQCHYPVPTFFKENCNSCELALSKRWTIR